MDTENKPKTMADWPSGRLKQALFYHLRRADRDGITDWQRADEHRVAGRCWDVLVQRGHASFQVEDMREEMR